MPVPAHASMSLCTVHEQKCRGVSSNGSCHGFMYQKVFDVSDDGFYPFPSQPERYACIWTLILKPHMFLPVPA